MPVARSAHRGARRQQQRLGDAADRLGPAPQPAPQAPVPAGTCLCGSPLNTALLTLLTTIVTMLF